jgi:predicted transcriptional regulator of viral defense system/very-short-patch-repair endonuclease
VSGVCPLDRAIRGQLTTPPDLAVAHVAATQHGIVTRAQLLSAGVSEDAIDRRLRAGRLLRVHRGVYAVGHIPPSPHAKSMAAVLACGPHAVLSHRSAAALYGLLRHHGPVEVTAPSNHTHRGITVHRSTLADRTTHYGVPVTTPARTLLDLADVLDPAALTRAVNEARLRHLLSTDDLDRTLRSSPGRRTSAFDTTQAPTRSVFEDAFLAFIDRHRFPRPEVNQHIHGYEVDMLWRPQRVIAELDGRAYHEHTFEDDREKDAHLLAADLTTVRVTWRRLTVTPDREARRFHALLATKD